MKKSNSLEGCGLIIIELVMYLVVHGIKLAIRLSAIRRFLETWENNLKLAQLTGTLNTYHT